MLNLVLLGLHLFKLSFCWFKPVWTFGTAAGHKAIQIQNIHCLLPSSVACLLFINVPL